MYFGESQFIISFLILFFVILVRVQDRLGWSRQDRDGAAGRSDGYIPRRRVQPGSSAGSDQSGGDVSGRRGSVSVSDDSRQSADANFGRAAQPGPSTSSAYCNRSQNSRASRVSDRSVSLKATVRHASVTIRLIGLKLRNQKNEINI